MNDLLIVKPNILSDVIDTSIGEPHIVRECLLKIFDLTYTLPKEKGMWEYPNPKGHPELIKILEDKYNAPIVITNGAMQGLHAVFHALKSMGKVSISWAKPWFHCLPKIAEMNGLQWSEGENGDAILLVAPRNPDGFMPSPEEVKKLFENCKEQGRYLIHDSVYYSHTYLPETYPLKPVGDVQIFSASKLLGLSGLRVGWIICHNKDFYHPIVEYMEAMTVGASMLSQIFLRDLLERTRAYPYLIRNFERLSSIALEKSKATLKGVDPEVLEVPENFEKINGMFAFCKTNDMGRFVKAKVNVADGKYFGMEGYVRMNLAFGEEKMKEIVKRLNEVKMSITHD